MLSAIILFSFSIIFSLNFSSHAMLNELLFKAVKTLTFLNFIDFSIYDKCLTSFCMRKFPCFYMKTEKGGKEGREEEREKGREGGRKGGRKEGR